MALTENLELPLGAPLPDFELKDVCTGKVFNTKNLMGAQGLLLMVICNHCPYVKHIIEKLTDLANEYLEKGIGMAAISGNDATKYPEDSPENMKKMAERLGFKFPYLYDESQEVLKKLQAVCTPEFFLFDQKGQLFYHGQFDSSRPGNNIPVTGDDLRNALECLLQGKSVEKQLPSVGCSIKWK